MDKKILVRNLMIFTIKITDRLIDTKKTLNGYYYLYLANYKLLILKEEFFSNQHLKLESGISYLIVYDVCPMLRI